MQKKEGKQRRHLPPRVLGRVWSWVRTLASSLGPRMVNQPSLSSTLVSSSSSGRQEVWVVNIHVVRSLVSKTDKEYFRVVKRIWVVNIHVVSCNVTWYLT